MLKAGRKERQDKGVRIKDEGSKEKTGPKKAKAIIG
jgi:hypothetical protein